MLIDAHAHLDLYDDVDSALAEIAQHRIFTISVAMDLPSYRQNLAIAERSDLVLPTFGVHPWKAPDYADRLDEIAPVIAESPMLGEIGLDFHWVEDEDQFPAQRTVLEYFLAAAQSQDKIVNLHTKGAEAEILDWLRRYDVRRAIVHWYSGPLDVFRDLVAFGAMFSIGVEVLHSDLIRTLARELPPKQLLTETDNPGGWQWISGELGRPCHIKDVVRALAGLRNTTTQGIIQTVRANFLRLVGDDPKLAAVAARLASGEISGSL
jgi:TatD DNase family protein